MKNASLIKLHDAYRAKRAAQELCPHWDYEGNICDDECCRALVAARDAVRRAREAAIAAGELERTRWG